MNAFDYITLHVYSTLLSEIDAGPIPLPNDKALKEKKRKLRETLDRMVKLYVSLVVICFIIHFSCQFVCSKRICEMISPIIFILF